LLGDSVRKRRGGRTKRSQPAGAPASGTRWTRKHWLAVLAALALPFGMGYLLAVLVIFPPLPVAGDGIAVPELVGKRVAEAQREMDALGLGALETTPLPSPDADEGAIMAQSPLPGQQLRAGAHVRVSVSSGRPRVLVPDVVGFPIERAAALLSRLGFTVQRVDEDSPVERGRVLGVDPGPGAQLQLPARVSVRVSTGVADTMQIDTTVLGGAVRTSRAGDAWPRWSGAQGRSIFEQDPPRTVPSHASGHGEP
jgi:hypothetical protein